MQDKEIQDQFHEIRNMLGRSQLILSDLRHQISQSKIAFQEAITSLEYKVGSIEICSRANANSIRLDEMASKIEAIVDENVQLRERVRRMEAELSLQRRDKAES